MNGAVVTSTRPGLSVRLDQWLLDRVREKRGAPELPFALEYRHIYVMPTRFGFWFAFLLIITGLGGLNFNNNMALMLGFLLASLALLTSLLAYRNLVGLSLVGIRAPAVFAGQPAEFNVMIRNPDHRPRFAIRCLLMPYEDCIDIAARQTAKFGLEQMSHRRGWLEMEPFHIENRYPLGLFKAWTLFIPRARCLVYPQPALNPPPLPNTGRGDEGTARVNEGEHFHGLREYTSGDPLKTIAWKASARHQKLYTRQMEAPSEEACEFNWYLMRGGDTEAKLSILTAWILKAEQLQIPYSLEMPSDALPAGLGRDHRDACLEILALFSHR